MSRARLPAPSRRTANGVKIIGHLNVPGRLAASASALYARNLYAFVETLVDKAIEDAQAQLGRRARQGDAPDPRRRDRASAPSSRRHCRSGLTWPRRSRLSRARGKTMPRNP